jgi:AcrR family transcriptional regulator
MSSAADAGSSDLARGARLPRSARRKQLLAAAQQVFVANGYHAAAMDDIAERAGVSKPVLYQHFPGKLELYLALLDTQAEMLRTAVTSALAETDDNRERIHGVLTAYFDFVGRSDEDGAFRLIFETDLGNEPAVRERVEAVTQKTMEAVADTVAGDTGLDRARAELLSTALTGAAQVAARWWLATERPISQVDAVRLLESLLWRGISNFPRQGDQSH